MNNDDGGCLGCLTFMAIVVALFLLSGINEKLGRVVDLLERSPFERAVIERPLDR